MPKKAMNYSNACVYKICCRDLEVTDVYVGSTTNLAKRRYQHKTTCTNEKDKNHNCLVYRFIRDHGGWDNWTVTKVQEATVTCSEDLLQLERACMERLGATLNKCVPSRSKKEYQEDNKEQISERMKDYYEANKTERLKKAKQYREAHKSEIAEKVKCQCGSMVGKYYMKRHCETAKHQKYLESLE